METVNVTLEGVQGNPLGHPDTRVNVTVTAQYSSPLILTDGSIIPHVIAEKDLGATGSTTFTVHASDGTEVHPDYRGFAITFRARITDMRGKVAADYARTVKVPSGGPHDLGSLPTAEPLPPDYASVAEVIGDFDARLDALEAWNLTVTDHGDGTSTVTIGA